MPRRRSIAAAALPASILALAALSPPSDAGAASADAAARGLDLFIDAPSGGVPGATFVVQIQALGFPTATTLAPLANASIELTWDPESLGPNVSSVPAGVTVTTDSAGRARADIPIPEGDPRSLTLLLGTTYGDHRRTREVRVQRMLPRELALIVPDDRVVPGGSTSAWAFLRDIGTGKPAVGETIVFELLEGGVPRFTANTKTDAAGTAAVRVPVPWTDEPTLSWTLSARALDTSLASRAVESIVLVPREETPGEPQLTAQWGEALALPGDRVELVLRLRDASDRPVVGSAVRYWIGPKGTDPPSAQRDPKAWAKASTLGITGPGGEVKAIADAPKTLRRGASTQVRVVATAAVLGHELTAESAFLVEMPSPTVDAFPEIGALVPGVAQSLVVQVRDPRSQPVSSTFLVEGDGLSQKVTTNAMGEAEVTWKVPLDIGATRNVGPCAGGVAATVSVRPSEALPALDRRTYPFQTCVPVSRELAGLVRPDKPVFSAGGSLRVRIVDAGEAGSKPSGASAKKTASAWSLIAEPLNPRGSSAVGTWASDPAEAIELPMRSAAPGTWFVGGLAPRTDKAARVAAGRVIVAPAVVPKVSAKLAGGRAAPLGTVEIDVDLTDGKGNGMPGAVGALLVDAFGGGQTAGLESLDTRRGLCHQLGVEVTSCDPFFDDAGADVLRKRVLSTQSVRDPSPLADPGATAKTDLKLAFRNVLLSLEGAVMDAVREPDTLRDAFRKENNRYSFNPELFTLVTAAMEPPPVTPGGEAITLPDLVAIDKQVTYDNVARRVARLRLFRILDAVRTYRRERVLDPDEPVLRDPNAILRRLVTSSAISAQDLVDPWGGTMGFVKAHGQKLPFVSVRGFELHAPGPDNKLGTADDVKSPFQRVVAAGTPYADAMDEERVVDAELDMEVSDPTVDNWRTLLEELTGQTLGDSFGAGGLGLSGFGSGGGGLGGVRHGATSVIRRSRGISSGAEFWLPPQRTDDKGHLRLQIPLGDVETTWRLAIVGAPDGSTPAVTSIDIPSALPLSARVDAGAFWIEGDEADAIVTLRNRTAAAATIDLTFTAGGRAELIPASATSRKVDVPAGGMVPVSVRMRARTAGTASLSVVANGPGGLEDRTTHTWEVRPAGEPVDMTSTQWVTGSARLALSQVGPGLRPTGTARLVLERGNTTAIEAALNALDPDTIPSQDGLSYAEEAASRIQAWATTRGGDADPIAVRARDLVRRSLGRMLARNTSTTDFRTWSAYRRSVRWAPADLVSRVAKVEECPSDSSPGLHYALILLEAEPTAADGAIEACWDSLATYVSTSFTSSMSSARDPVALARAVLAFAERPQRAAMAAALAEKLRVWVDLQPSGRITLPPADARSRASRAVVLSALLRTASMGKPAAATPERIAAWLRVQRDMHGGYGSPIATLAAVRAFLSHSGESKSPTTVTVTADGLKKTVEVGPNATVTVPLGAKALSVDLQSQGPGLVARLVRPGLRLWSHPPDNSAAPVALDIVWPEAPRAGEKSVVRVLVASRTLRPFTADVRIPLPPGASLAERTAGVRQIQGQLILQPEIDLTGTPTVLDLPLRFGLAGRFTVPEARARPAHEDAPRAIAPARPLVVK
ncbi:MAG: hypothetical protein R3F14_15960 [Polyangiaceae bacterium]